MAVFIEGLWGQVSQGGYNLLTGACSVAAVCSNTTFAGANNNVQVKVGMAGLALSF
jgi:hypothetical protein